MGCEGIIEGFFNMQHSIKLYHWQTQLYARHVAMDALLQGLHPLIDQFVEVYIGRYKRPTFGGSIKLYISEMGDDAVVELLKDYVKFLKIQVPKELKSSDTDLLNIRDEMVALLNRTLYLFTLQ